MVGRGVERRRIDIDTPSAATQRAGLDEALRALRPGNQLVVWRLDRLARSVRELESLADRLAAEGVELRAAGANRTRRRPANDEN